MMIDAKNYFNEHGYVIFRQNIEKDDISILLKCFKNFVHKNGMYYSQSNHNWRKAHKDTDEFGLLKNSMESFTSLLLEPKLAEAGKKILLSDSMLNCLSQVSGLHEDFCMWQNMLFDRSVGTVDHIDTWYLDTDPMGYLIGAWIALEDIDGQGGSFHVYPGSHKMNNNGWRGLTHDQFVEWSNETKKKYKKVSMHLKKGDVLLWHPSLIHGSSNQEVNGFSRKSLTAHYHPISFKQGGGGIETSVNSDSYNKSIMTTMSKMKKFDNLPIYTFNRWETTKSSVKGLIKYFTGFKNPENSLMQRDAYDFKKSR